MHVNLQYVDAAPRSSSRAATGGVVIQKVKKDWIHVADVLGLARTCIAFTLLTFDRPSNLPLQQTPLKAA